MSAATGEARALTVVPSFRDEPGYWDHIRAQAAAAPPAPRQTEDFARLTFGPLIREARQAQAAAHRAGGAG